MRKRPTAARYGAREMPTDHYRARTDQNVRDAGMVLWFGSTDTPGVMVRRGWSCLVASGDPARQTQGWP